MEILVDSAVKAKLLFLAQLHYSNSCKQLCDRSGVKARINGVVYMSAFVGYSVGVKILKIVAEFGIDRTQKAYDALSVDS